MIDIKGNIKTDNSIKTELKVDGKIGGGISVPMNIKSYNQLRDKPTLNSVTIEGDKVSADYKLQDKLGVVSEQDIDVIIYG